MRLLIFSVLIFFSQAVSAVNFVFHDPFYSFHALRTASLEATGGAQLSECLQVCEAIEGGNEQSWYREWWALADRLEQGAEIAVAEERVQTASSLFLRASNYYRTAEFMLRGKAFDGRVQETAERSRHCFRRGMMLSEVEFCEMAIPFEGGTLPGYLFLVDGAVRPLLIAQTGFDGTAEELYLTIGQVARDRGYHLLIFEGPGQGVVLREQGMPFRPDWEMVLTPVVDAAVSLTGVDPDRIGLMGYSFGGLLAARALAFEPRVKVAALNPGSLDFYAGILQQAPEGLGGYLDSPFYWDAIDSAILQLARTDSKLRWVIGHGMWSFGAKRPAEWLVKTRDYHIRDTASQITAEVLVIESEGDQVIARQAEQLFAHLTCPKTFMLFTVEEGAGEHCQVGAQQLANCHIFDWLDQRLKPKSSQL